MSKIKTKIPGFFLKIAKKQDTPLILKFIRELAEYEKLIHEVTATEDILRKNLFSKKKSTEVIIAYYKEIPVGFSLFFHNFSTFLGKPGIYVEDIYISGNYRNRGFGKEIFSYFAGLAVKRDCGRLEWSVLNWNKPALSFYKKIGAKSMDEWKVMRVIGRDIKKIADKL